ncbi:G2/mitotic-specific cyclin S13-7-like isoform X2 [Macadamia integrifolia]|uniref:G2/mitotic-specific cyclin S13-7-like isoform X2 n=1 Tax=Macadamia integrifolia TaxID=60698 RepID=UPI001C4F6420|nr:G2/mitotic-specific cyclin S13-7-like isoform X2 [Macadamia integrifolia]
MNFLWKFAGAAVAGLGKQKNAAADGKNRRALEDVSNLGVTNKGLEGKPLQQITRPVTRGFCAQLLANAQAAAQNDKKPTTEIVDGVVIIDADVAKRGGAAKAAQKKVTVKPVPDTVIEISPDTEEESKPKKLANRRKSREGSSGKKVKTLTATLTARSKAACGLTGKPKEPIVDIDAADVNDQLAIVEYVEDIYQFYKLTEHESRVQDYMVSQPDIDERMREILADWLIEVHHKFELMPETLFLTLYIVDRFLSLKTVPRKELQLLGIGAMLISSKYEEIWAPEVSDFILISDKAYTREQVLGMEKAILGRLEWSLTVPTPYVFLVRFIKAAGSDQEMENMAFFLAELGLMRYATIMYCPSMVAASAVYAARCTMNKTPLWNETLKLHTGYTESQLMDCAKLLVSFHSSAAESKLKGVYKKYSSPERRAVALLPPAKNLTICTSLSKMSLL